MNFQKKDDFSEMFSLFTANVAEIGICDVKLNSTNNYSSYFSKSKH